MSVVGSCLRWSDVNPPCTVLTSIQLSQVFGRARARARARVCVCVWVCVCVCVCVWMCVFCLFACLWLWMCKPMYVCLNVYVTVLPVFVCLFMFVSVQTEEFAFTKQVFVSGSLGGIVKEFDCLTLREFSFNWVSFIRALFSACWVISWSGSWNTWLQTGFLISEFHLSEHFICIFTYLFICLCTFLVICVIISFFLSSLICLFIYWFYFFVYLLMIDFIIYYWWNKE